MVRRLALRHRIVAVRNHRTVHSVVTPRLGGISLFLTFALALMVCASYAGMPNRVWGLLAASTLVVLLGLVDDVRGVSCYRKLAAQTLAAGLAVYFGWRVETVTLPGGTTLALGVWSAPLSLLWIVGLTNAMNLLDGLDGLATGVAGLTAAALAAVAALNQQAAVAVLALALAGACAGFLRYNFAPARIFLGDTGSLLLGFALACLALPAFALPAGGVNLVPLLVLFFLPLADTTLALLRRVSRGRHPFHADKEHIHHKLLERGGSHRSVAGTLYLAALASGLAALAVVIAPSWATWTLLSAVLLLHTGALVRLGCFDFVRAPTEVAEVCETTETWVD